MEAERKKKKYKNRKDNINWYFLNYNIGSILALKVGGGAKRIKLR